MENCLKIICCKSSVEKIPVREIKKTQTNKTFMASKYNFNALFFFFWSNFIEIHRMQIWRTTRSAPGTSRMKARLVRLWCFVLTMLFQQSLSSLSIWSLCFAFFTRFCVPECHRKRVKFSTTEKVFFFSVILFVSKEKLKRRRQGVYDRRRNCLSSGSKMLENE